MNQYQVVSSFEGALNKSYRMEDGKKWRQYLAAVLCKCWFGKKLKKNSALKPSKKVLKEKLHKNHDQLACKVYFCDFCYRREIEEAWRHESKFDTITSSEMKLIC